MDNITIKFLEDYNDEKKRSELLNLLTLCDSEFVPALSSRESTTQTNLQGDAGGGDKKINKIPYSYFNNLLNYRGVKFANVKFVVCCVNTNTIRFYTNIDNMVIEFAM